MSAQAATRRITESDFQRAVIDLGRQLGWKISHFHDSRRALANGRLIGDRDAAGWPDLVLVRDGWMIVAELKRDGGRCTAQQEAWLLALADVEENTEGQVHVTVWRPSDWSTIVSVLKDRGRR